MVCRVCKQKIQAQEDYIMPSRNYYYHKNCYERWKSSAPINDEEYVPLIYDFISRELKKEYDYFVCEAQRKKFLKDKMTNKGIYFSLKYFYDIKKQDWEKGHGGIGIVPYIYKTATEYWANQEQKTKGLLASIVKNAQMLKEEEKPVVVVHKKKKERKTYKISDYLEGSKTNE